MLLSQDEDQTTLREHQRDPDLLLAKLVPGPHHSGTDQSPKVTTKKTILIHRGHMRTKTSSL